MAAKAAEIAKLLRARQTAKLPSGFWLFGCWLAVTLLGLLSFRAYAAHLTPGLDSDSAIHILMAADLRLPQDLYYWGQDRLGSLLPLLAHVLLQVTALSPVQAVALVQYALLVVGWLCLSSLFKTGWAKLLFAVAWFLPIFDFSTLVITAHPYGPQFALIGLAIVLFNRLFNRVKPGAGWSGWLRTQGLLGLIGVCLTLSFWVSDFSIVLIAALVGLAIWKTLRSWFHVAILPDQSVSPGQRVSPDQRVSPGQTVLIRAEIPQMELVRLGLTSLNTALVAGLGLGAIGYAKQTATAQSNYAKLVALEQLQANVGRLISAWWQTITFRANPFLSLYGLLLSGLLVYWGYWGYRTWRQRRLAWEAVSEWAYVFGGSALLGLVLLVTSWWVYTNDTNLRYFVPIYIAAWMALLLILESFAGKARRLSFWIAGLALLAALATQPHVFAISRPPAKVEQLQPLATLGRTGFIGDYWSSYILCTANPKALACTSHDLQNQTSCDLASIQAGARTQAEKTRNHKLFRRVRCERCAKRVLRTESIYLVQKDWLSDFPAEIQQFGQCLVKVGDPQTMAGYRMAPYRAKARKG